jgi:D-alanyl-D-alanine carboxypeptidase (penicillin-binding protein 5/6)
MLTRRSSLLASACLIGAALPAAAQPRHPPPTPRAAGGHGKKDQAAMPTDPANTPIGPVDTAARWAYAQDFNTSATLLEKAADDHMPPSSMTKLMTIYLVYERLKQGKLKLDDQLLVSEKAWRMGGSKMFVQIGTQVAVEDLIRGLIVDSGNDACLVLSEGIAGSEEQFVEMMNAKAKLFGMTNTHYQNCTGWPDPDQYMSARDIATLAHHIIADFPQYYHYDSEKTFKYNNIEQENRNPLVQRGSADGLKTGHTEAGGYGVVASTLRGNRRVILVLNGMNTMRERAEESERLMDWAFANFEDVTLFTAGDVVERVPVWLGTSPTVSLVGGRDLSVTMPRNWRNSASIKVSYDTPILAPVAKGTPLGKLVVSGQGVPDMDVPLLAGEDVERLGLPGRAIAVLSHYVTGG